MVDQNNFDLEKTDLNKTASRRKNKVFMRYTQNDRVEM